VTQLRVFLATPGSLDDERKVFRETICEFNEMFAHEQGFVLVPVGWEQVPPGVGRAQGLINEKVRDADYLVVVLWDRWGTPTSRNSQFTSGTQEELTVALQCLGDRDTEMRDVAVFFKAVEERQLSDPGPQLQRVLQFKDALESSNELLFGTFDTGQELRNRLNRLFMSWLNNFGDRVPRMVSLPESGDGAVVTASSGAGPSTISGLLERADELAGMGLVTQAEIAYADAVSTGDRGSLISYAKFLRRTGRLEKAFEINKRVLGLEILAEESLPASAADRSYVTANMGVIRRKQGELRSSRHYLDEAVRTADSCPDSTADESKAYALDNLGLTLRRLGDNKAALASHDRALRIRERLGDERAQAKTLLNLARLLKDQDQLGKAKASATRALEILRATKSEKHALANAYATLGDVTRADNDTASATKHYKTALRLNEELSHKDGIAIVYCQLALLRLTDADPGQALGYAERSLEENVRSGNKEGQAIALRVLGDVQMATRSFGKAQSYYRASYRMFLEQQNQTGAIIAKIGMAEALDREGRSQESALAVEEAHRLAQTTLVRDDDLARIAKLRSRSPRNSE